MLSAGSRGFYHKFEHSFQRFFLRVPGSQISRGCSVKKDNNYFGNQLQLLQTPKFPARILQISSKSFPSTYSMATGGSAFMSTIPEYISKDVSGPRRNFQIVVAATSELGIGKDGKLPWKLPSDMKFFKNITQSTSASQKKNAVIMGRKTWESIPLEFRPLSGRLNVILSSSGSFDIATAENSVTCGSLSSALEMLATPPYSMSIETVFVIGGGQIFKEAFCSANCEAIHITEIENQFECDTFMPSIDTTVYRPWYSSFPFVDKDIRYCFTTYVRKSKAKKVDSETAQNGSNALNLCKMAEHQQCMFLPKFIFERHEEYVYLRLVQDIISNGTERGDRTGTGTLSKFGCQMGSIYVKLFLFLQQSEYSGVVLLKSCYGLSVVPQMLRFYTTKAYIYGMAMHQENTLTKGDLGPVYGFQWRHFGARYTDMHADYKGQGFDQLADVIHKIKNSPDDRRIILSAWNPADIKLMTLPPCHMFAQFYVAKGELSCQMYQRSCDMGLGVPFNIASYGLLTCMIAHVCDLVPGDFIHVLGDAHVYKSHITPLLEQLQNLPKPFPVLKINPEKKDIDFFVASDFQLEGYDSYKIIEMKMAV